MSSNVLRKVISKNSIDEDEVILIESAFQEASRRGKYLKPVRMALTSSRLLIASNDGYRGNKSATTVCYEDFESCQMFPLKDISLSIFKKSERQSLKACYSDTIRYFDLSPTEKRKIYWKLWCIYIDELRSPVKLWPFTSNLNYRPMSNESIHCSCWDKVDFCEEENPVVNNTQTKWTDKYLNLGSKRDKEDQNRPTPIPGLGPTDEIKLSYLKPEYFGCWDQTEHWVQCESSNVTSYDYDVYTYTGEPTSNVTYTSLITTWK